MFTQSFHINQLNPNSTAGASIVSPACVTSFHAPKPPAANDRRTSGNVRDQNNSLIRSASIGQFSSKLHVLYERRLQRPDVG